MRRSALRPPHFSGALFKNPAKRAAVGWPPHAPITSHFITAHSRRSTMPKRSKVKAQTANAREPTDDKMDDPEVFARHKNNTLKFWRMCLRPRCQRGKSCLGDDARDCFKRHWEIVPEEI